MWPKCEEGTPGINQKAVWRGWSHSITVCQSSKRAGGWPLGPTDVKDMFNLTRDLELVIKTTHSGSLVVYSGTKLKPERSYFT